MARVKKPGDRRGIGGRPTKFTEECIRKLEEMFMIDSTVEEACLSAGVSTVQYYEHLKSDERFANKMRSAQLYPGIYARKTLIKSMRSGDEKVAQKGAIEYLTRRDRRYSTKVEESIDANVNGEIKSEVKLEDKSMIELEEMRKALLK